jgi:hypothetical protein
MAIDKAVFGALQVIRLCQSDFLFMAKKAEYKW